MDAWGLEEMRRMCVTGELIADDNDGLNPTVKNLIHREKDLSQFGKKEKN